MLFLNRIKILIFIKYFFFKRIQFPLGDKLPATNNPVALFGQVPRFQREQELEYFLSKQCNSLGIRIQNKLISVENNFLMNQALTMNEANNSSNTNNAGNPQNVLANSHNQNTQAGTIVPSSALLSATSTATHNTTN